LAEPLDDRGVGHAAALTHRLQRVPPPRCSKVLTIVVMMRAPLAPNGCPMAIAPPFTFVLAKSAPASLAQASVGFGGIVMHRVGPSDMPFKLRRFRHVAVAIPIVAMGGLVAVSPRQQSPQPQQPNLTYHQTVIGGRGR
jgi:hypothetical protein